MANKAGEMLKVLASFYKMATEGELQDARLHLHAAIDQALPILPRMLSDEWTELDYLQEELFSTLSEADQKRLILLLRRAADTLEEGPRDDAE